MSQFVSNKDVSPNAEIEGTKIVSDFGNQDIFADGYIALGLVPSDIGSVRLTNNTKVAFRSFDNLSNIEALFVDTSNKLVIGHGTSNVDFKVGSGIAIPITPETVSTWAVVQDGYALIAAGGGTRAVWGPAGLDNGMVVDNIADLRMLTDADATMVNVTGHAPGTRLGGGFFTWNPLPKPDDNGLRFNAGGIGSNTAGWDRIILADSDLNVTWFGAQLDGIADDTGALASTVDAALLDGYRRVYIPQGTLRYTSTLTIDTDHVSIYGSNLTDENGLVAGTILQYDGAGAGILIGRNIGASLTATYHTTLRGFTLKVPTTCSHAIRAWCPAYLRIDSVNVIGMIGNTRYGIMVEQGVDVEIRNCNVTGDNLTYDADRTTYANGIDIRHALGSPSTTTRVDKCYIHRCYESLTVYGSFAHSTDTIMEGGFRGFLCNGGRLALASCWIENCGVTGGAAAGYLTASSEAHLVACNIVGYTDPQYIFNVVGTARLILEGGQIASDHGTPGLINPGDYTYGSGYVSVTDVDIASDISYGINYLATGGVQDRARRFVGDNDPAGVVYGNVGDLFQRNNGGAGTSLYIKESGTNTTSGWRAIISNDGYADGILARDVAELRALSNNDAQTAVLESYGPTYAGGGGMFVWDPYPSTDNSGTRFNAGGHGSNTAGWERVRETNAVKVEWFGVVANGVTNDTLAVSRAISVVTTDGAGIIEFPLGVVMVDPNTINFDGPGSSDREITLRGVTRGAGQYAGGSQIRSTGSGSYLVRFAAQGIRCENLTFHGGSDSPGDPAVDSVVFFDYQTNGCGLEKCSVYGARTAAPITVTPDHTTNTFTAVGHGLLDGYQVLFRSTSSIPAGLHQPFDGVYNWIWFVVNATGSTFQIALTSGGSPFDFTDNGSGTITAHRMGGADWGHLVRIGGSSGFQADQSFIRDCTIRQDPTDSNHLVSRGIFISDSNATLWTIENTQLYGCVDGIYIRGGGCSVQNTAMAGLAGYSRASYVKEGITNSVNITNSCYVETDAIPMVVITGSQSSDYSRPWRISGNDINSSRAHINWDCRQPLILEGNISGSVIVTATGGQYVTCLAPILNQVDGSDPNLARFKGATERLIMLGATRLDGYVQNTMRRLSGPSAPYDTAGRHGYGLFLDGGNANDHGIRRGGPVVIDLDQMVSGENLTAPLLLGKRIDGVIIDSVTPAANTIDKTAHGLTNWDSVKLSTNGTLPGGLTSGFDYWVIEDTVDTFKLSREQNGEVIDITDAGTGTHIYRALTKSLAIYQDNNVGERPNQIRMDSPDPIALYTPSLTYGPAGDVTVHMGTGSPEGVVAGGVGDLYHRTGDGYEGFTLYVKESGTGTTGWRSLSTTTNTEVTEVRYLAATAGGDVATEGAVRLASGDSIEFRDSSNTVNVTGIGLDASDNLTIGDDLLPGNIIIGDPAMPGQVIVNSGISASTRIDGYDAFVATAETSTTWASALDGYVAVVAGSGSRVEWAAISASIITSGGANQVLWSNGVSNVWTSTPTITSITADYIAFGALPAAGGQIRLQNTSTVRFRNSGNTSDITVLQIDGSDNVYLGANSNVTYVDSGTNGLWFRVNGSIVAQYNSSTYVLTVPNQTWVSSAINPTISQGTDSTNGITGDTLTIQAQNATGTTTTGGILKLQSGTGTTAPGSIQLWVGANQSAQFGRNASDFLAFGDEPADTGTIRFSHLSNIVGEAVTPGTDVPLLEWGTYISGRLSVGHSSIGVLHLRAGTTAILNGSNANIWSASTDINVYVSNEQWAESVSSPQILQLTRGSDAAVQNFTITPQAPYGSASVNTKGGDLVVALASPVGGGTAEASFKITRGGAFYAAIGKADSAAYTRLWMGPSLTPSASNYALQSNGSSTFINGISEVNFAISGVNYAIFTGALFEWTQGVTTPTIGQATRTSGAPQNMLIAPQPPDGAASGANRRPGSLVVSLAAPTNGGTDEAALVVNRGGSHYVSIGPRVSDSARSAIYLTPGVTPTTLNYTVAADASSTILNSNGSSFLVAFSGVNKLTIGTYYLQWAYDVASPIFNQGTDATNGVTGDTFTIQAQSTSGTTSTGGSLKLQSGTGTSAAGSVQLFAGTSQVGQFGAASGDYLAFGADPADSGTIRFSAGATIKGEANPTGTDATILTYTDQTALEVGSSGITTTTISGTTVEINGASATLIEAVEIAAGRRVVSLVLGADLTTTEMPASTGDRVVFVANAATNPSANPVGGFILYADNGQPTFRTSDGYTLTVGSVDVGGANEVYWSNGSTNSWTGAPTITSLNASSYVSVGAGTADAGVIRIAHGAVINARNNAGSANRNVIGFGNTTADWITIGDTGGAGTYLRTQNVQYNTGSTIWTLDSARFRFYGNFEVVWELNAISPLIKHDTDSTNGITGDTFTIQAQNATGTTTTGGSLKLQSGTGTTAPGSIQLFAGTTQVGQFGISASDYISLGTNTASSGVIRIGNATAINARNAANSANINLASTDASNNIFLGANSATTYLDAGSTVYIRFGGSTAVTFNASNVLLTQTNLQWTQETTSPLISQQQKPDDVSGAPQNMKISAQYAFATASGANRTPGSLLLDIGIPTNGSTVEGFVKVTRNSTVYFSTGALPGNTTYASVWLGPSITPSSSNYTFAADGSSIVILNSPGSLAFYTNGTSPQIILSAALFQWYQNISSPIISHAAKVDDSAAPTNFTIRGQYPYASASTEAKKTPGSVIADVGVPTNSGTTEAGFKVTRNGTLHCQIGAYNTPPSYSSVWLGPGITPSTTNFAFLGDGTSLTYLNAPSGGTVFISLAGSGAYGISVTSTILQFNSTETLQWVKGATAPLLKQVIKDANETPRNITIEPQAPWNNASCTGVNRYPGHLVVALAAPVQSATTEASLKITRGGTFAAALGPLTDGYGTTNSALWLVPGTTPTWQNWQVASSSTLLGINAYSTTGSIQFMAGGNYVTNLSYTGNMSWYRDVIPMLSQETQPGDYATNNFEIRAQGAYASASTNKNGGDLLLKSGAEASGGLGGSLKLYIGAQGMMELREVASGRNIIALCTTGVTTTEMPANTGNMVIYIANCSTVPTGNPTSGGILYVDDGNLYWRDPSGVSTQLN